MIRKMCDWLCSSGLQDCPLHFSRFTPLYKLAHLPATPVATLEKARDLALKAGIRYVYIGNVPGHMAENTFCHHCHRQVVERRGFVIVQNDITKGACKHCGGTIPGVWS
jgi:pyruvate formate lyase activating enzyme